MLVVIFLKDMLIDTHAHLNFSDFDSDRNQIIQNCLDNNIWMINVGTSFESSKKSIEIAEKYSEGVYATVGVHPMNESEDIYSLMQSDKIVAVGEAGLDYYKRPKNKAKRKEFEDKQKEAFLIQANIAKEFDLPMIIHCRYAHKDMIPLLKDLKGVIHCFTGDLDDLEKYLNLGFYIGFNGIIFKLDLDDVISKTPIERILIETDCPYLGPTDKRNDPIDAIRVAKRIAEIKGVDYDLLKEKTSENAKRLFLGAIQS